MKQLVSSILTVFLLTPLASRADDNTRAEESSDRFHGLSRRFSGGPGVGAGPAGLIHICPAVHEGRGWPCSWYLRINGLTPGQQVTLKVSANAKPFRDGQRLAASWSQPQRTAI